MKRIAYVAMGCLIFLTLASAEADDNCSYDNVDVLPSPTGNLSIARTEYRCSSDEDVPPMMFALLRSGVQFDKERVFVTSANYEGIQSSLSILPKWIDDHNLIIAAPEGARLKTMRTEFDGVHIQYANYPKDSDKVKDEHLRRQVEKKGHFEPMFSKDDGVGVPGIGCYLTVRVHDGEYLDELSLILTARTTFAVKARQPPDYKKIVLNEAYSSFNFQIVARDKVERPDKHATGADVVGFAPKDGRSKLAMTSFSYPRIKAPNGEPMPKWDFVYSPKDPHDIVSIAKKIKAGNFAIRVGYWLDNKVIVYHGVKPGDQKPIEMFEQCINQNHIFDTPQIQSDH